MQFSIDFIAEKIHVDSLLTLECLIKHSQSINIHPISFELFMRLYQIAILFPTDSQVLSGPKVQSLHQVVQRILAFISRVSPTVQQDYYPEFNLINDDVLLLLLAGMNTKTYTARQKLIDFTESLFKTFARGQPEACQCRQLQLLVSTSPLRSKLCCAIGYWDKRITSLQKSLRVEH